MSYNDKKNDIKRKINETPNTLNVFIYIYIYMNLIINK